MISQEMEKILMEKRKNTPIERKFYCELCKSYMIYEDFYAHLSQHSRKEVKALKVIAETELVIHEEERKRGILSEIEKIKIAKAMLERSNEE